MSVTLESLRADVAALVEIDPSQIADDASLMDLGLDSMRGMNLVMQWEEAGVPLDVGDLFENPTIGGLWALVRERQG